MPKCSFIHPDGRPCGGYAVHGDSKCMAHTSRPSVMAKAQEGRSRGGKARNKDALEGWADLDIQTGEDLRRALSDLFNAGIKGEISTARISALATVANALEKAIEGSKMAKDIQDLKDSLEALR